MPESSNPGGRKPRVTDDDLLDVFRATSDPVLSTAEVAEQVPIKRRGVLNRLRQLEQQDTLASKQIGGRNTVWWLKNDIAKRDSSRPSPAETPAATDNASAPTDANREDTPAGDALDAVEFPGGRDRDDCLAAIYTAREYLREHGPASMREIVTDVMPEHPLGYDVVDDLEPGDRYRGAWWRKVVRPGLKALDDVDAPAGGGKWRIED